MLALILVAVVAAIFWRSLLKIGLAIVMISFFLLLITGAAALIEGFHHFIP